MGVDAGSAKGHENLTQSGFFTNTHISPMADEHVKKKLGFGGKWTWSLGREWMGKKHIFYSSRAAGRGGGKMCQLFFQTLP